MTTRPGPLVRAARAIGDFDNPFYDEERQRDVWNEASAFGFQLVLIATLLATTVTIWVVGAPALRYVQGAVILVGLASILTIGYASRLGVDVTQPQRLVRVRMVPVALVLVALIVGMLRASATDLSASTVAGMVTGAAVVAGLAGAAYGFRRRTGS